MGHSVGDAAARSVAKSNKKEAVANRTTEQRIHDIRMNAESILSVPNSEVVFLLAEYDKLAATQDAEDRNQVEYIPETLQE